MSVFLKAAEQQLIMRSHNPEKNDAGISAAITVNGVFSEIRFKDINGQMGVCTLELVGLNIDDDMEGAMAELVMLLNNRTESTTAIYDPNEGSLETRASVPIFEGVDLANTVEMMIVNTAVTAKNLMAMAIPVLAGVLSPGEAVVAATRREAE